MRTESATEPIKLDPAQLAAVMSTAPQILCLAGPGSGKTRVLVERIAALLRNGTDPATVCIISYTNAAAKEITERLGGQVLGHVGTLHSLMLRICRTNSGVIGFGPNIVVIDEEQARAMLDQSIEALKYRGALRDVQTCASLNPLLVAEPGQTLATPALVAVHFHRALQAANLMTFDTVLQYGAHIINGRGFEINFDHLLVDEFQDSADIDAEIYWSIPIPNKFFVGDPDQAIFGFRGGNVRNIVGAVAGSEVHRLETNYRSDRFICSAAQRLIEHNKCRVAKATVSAAAESGSAVATYHTHAGAELAVIANQLGTLNGQSCAVLCRYNVQVDEVTQYLSGLGIPVVKRASVDLPKDWRASKNLVALLADPDNNTLAYWVIAESKSKDKADFARLTAQATGTTINQKFLNIPYLLAIADVPAILARAGMSQESIGLIEKAAALLQPEATVGDLSLALGEVENSKFESGDGVVVTTYHGAKGREWDVVFLPAFEQELIPGGKKFADIEEERRLAYVGITRARHAVFISHTGERQPNFGGRWAKPAKAIPSQFIAEAGL